MALYFQLFWLPAAVSAVQLRLMSAERGLTGDFQISVLVFVVCVAVQYWSPTTGAWIAAVGMQTALAIYLVLRRRWEA
jgi:hypothetical protein